MLEQMEILDVITVLALSLVVASLALAWATRMAVRLMCNLRDEETEHAHTRRRLADVERLRRRDAVADAHDDGGPCTDCGTTGWGSDHDEDCRNNPARRFDPEEESELPVAIRGPVPNSIKASHRSAKDGHAAYVAVDGGGCAPPIVVKVKTTDELRAEREVERAYADAGIMPVADYVAKHGGED